MAKVDNVMKDHVTAARKWLGKAENSLENKNNIRGDLHIMLAEAEIKRAREKMTEFAKPFWRKYIIPLSAGVLLLAAGSYQLTVVQDRAAAVKPVPPIVVAAEKQEENTVTAVQTPPPESIKEIAGNEPAAISPIVQQPAAEKEIKESAVKKDHEEIVPKKEDTEKAIQAPSKKMQQLMHTAKSTLQE
ncbi:hypothetical protein [Pectinatus haikarae]|uniref:Uncharacterized protein n=1 Tax=Pectinatus haikarae TaxID=349096 RepID=A0ABT9Y5H8_9FIRM|nr:hypothetical protein [Pectinatus haikarae]MDQ0203077.1 hypothetical protein [Pectinatus haikarae]